MQGPGNPGAFCYFYLLCCDAAPGLATALRCDSGLVLPCRDAAWGLAAVPRCGPVATSAPWMHIACLVLQTVRTAMRFAPANACEIWYIFLQIGYIYLRAGSHVSTMLPV